MSNGRRRGRPRDPAVDRVILRETLALLDSGGYERLRMADVGRKAGVGLGSLYRRWPTKYALVVDALRAAAPAREVELTDDPVEDLAAVLEAFAEELGDRGTLLAVLLTDPASEVAAAVREAKIHPASEATRERLHRVIGPVPDLQIRADVGPALIFQHLLLHGAPPEETQIREHILPLMTH
ncbi:DNA-binding transcriptional regulator, AcrR family [Thermomonospora echinospora]|uniref:DNA-binding transcriptional regulator, AcrR family n=1 Tax=Thermomonospora echinospora TaxID=1992 RepID=A0A1H6DNE5_9ACTN|nr:TetR/AcrR family transcriptional regulator [Thermomonospora echinospora]SEG86263.1 DNA-binding transcriptional regulator, AcrR family [Thermomonospora echinospora]